MLLSIDLHLPPPTADEMASALASAKSTEKAFDRRTNRCVLIAFISGLTCIACLVYAVFNSLTDVAAALTLVGFFGSLFACIAAGVLANESFDRTSTLYEPMDAAASEKLIKACLRDGLVDKYRQQVIAQGRPLTSLEFRAIMKWDCGREVRKLAELAMQDRPLTEADLAATQGPLVARCAQDFQPTGAGAEMLATTGAAHG